MALLIVINCTFIGIKNNIFLNHEFVYSEVCNFLGCFLVELFPFFFFTKMPYFLILKDIKQSNQQTHRLLS